MNAMFQLFYNTIAACQRPVGPLLSNKCINVCKCAGQSACQPSLFPVLSLFPPRRVLNDRPLLFRTPDIFILTFSVSFLSPGIIFKKIIIKPIPVLIHATDR